MATSDDDSYLFNMVEVALVDEVNNLARLSDNFMRYVSTEKNSSFASCNVGNI